MVRVALTKTKSRSCSDGVCPGSATDTATCCKIDNPCELNSFLSLVLVVNLQGHWCGRELAAMMLHSQGCTRWMGPNEGGAYEEARQV